MSIVNFDEIKTSRKIQNFSTFKGGEIKGAYYDKPVSYIKAYLADKVYNGELSEQAIIEAKGHFLNMGIVKATVNTQINLFKNKLIENNGKIDKTPTLQYALKSINDLVNFQLVATVKNDKVNIIDKALYENENILKIAISLNDIQLIISQKSK